MLRLWLRKNLLRSFRLTREMLHASLQANFSLTIEIHIVIKKTFTKNRFPEKLCSWKKRIQSKYFTGSRILQSSLHCCFSYLSVQPFRIIFITIEVWVNRNDEEKCFRIRRHSFKRKLQHEWKSVSPTFCYKGWILGKGVFHFIVIIHVKKLSLKEQQPSNSRWWSFWCNNAGQLLTMNNERQG